MDVMGNSDMMEIDVTTRQFINEHRTDDVRQLALQASKHPDVDMPFALNQIAGWQTARRKVPTWAATNGIIYPPHLNMEQCSSELTARYKVQTTNRPCDTTPTLQTGRSSQSVRRCFVDLTGGFGVDFFFMSQDFEECIYVEQNPQLCAISSNNFKCLGLNATVVNADAETYLQTMPLVDVIYMDPARRNEQGGRTYDIADCTPNVLELMPLLTAKSRRLILKLSPMLDWRKAVEDLKTHLQVSEVHIISVQNECKELVIVTDQQEAANNSGDIQVACVNILPNGNHEVFHFNVNQDGNENLKPSMNSLSSVPSPTGRHLQADYLFEPNASVMKAGCFGLLAQRFHLQPLAANSHLFLTDNADQMLPGRVFRIDGFSSMNKKELKKRLAGIDSANITVRNFPLSVADLRKRLKLKDGGEKYLFATTLSTGEHVLFFTHKNIQTT